MYGWLNVLVWRCLCLRWMIVLWFIGLFMMSWYRVGFCWYCVMFIVG